MNGIIFSLLGWIVPKLYLYYYGQEAMPIQRQDLVSKERLWFTEQIKYSLTSILFLLNFLNKISLAYILPGLLHKDLARSLGFLHSSSYFAYCCQLKFSLLRTDGLAHSRDQE
jgi:hypothetical protein